MDEINPLGFEDINYPQTDLIGKSTIRVCHGWFFPDLDPDEPAWYLDEYIDKDGKSMIVLDSFGYAFDFDTPLLDYIDPLISPTHTVREMIAMGYEVPT